ncbi:MAG: efflux RND transporter periplasmic adaptor subunit [Planctomycetes bacterium]|nr:efflux RND transporter periplasmic adaptor subunit [Planctomycetota bacterium]
MTSVSTQTSFFSGAVASEQALPVSSSEGRLVGLVRRLSAVVPDCESEQALLAEIARAIEAAYRSTGVYFFRDGRIESLLALRRIPGDALDALLEPTLVRVAESACEKRSPQNRPLPDASARVVGVPLLYESRRDVLLAVARADREGSEQIAAALELAASFLRFRRGRQDVTRMAAEVQSMAALVELLGKVEASDDLDQAAFALVTETQQFVGAGGGAVGLCAPGATRTRVAAVAGLKNFDARSELSGAVEAALDEAVLRGSLAVWPAGDAGERHGLLAHRKLAELVKSAAVVSAPLVHRRGQVQGAWVFWGEGDLAAADRVHSLLRAARQPAACALRAVRHARRNWWVRSGRRIGRWARTRRGWLALLAVAGIVGAMFVPVDYQVKCDCELQPVERRFVSSPFEGTLEQALVEPGELVTHEKLLARMDGREVRWELARVAADYNRAAKERDAHLAAHEFAEANIKRLEMERLALKTQLLDHRAENLEIKSPVDGIVIAGDLKRSEGVRLTTGQTLFEIAPLDRMVVEIAVPEEDIAYVTPDGPVEIQLDAFPGETWSGRLERIHPRSEIRDEEHVFIAEVRLDNPRGVLRPGMTGRARIAGPEKTLGWTLFHKPWERIVLQMGW